MGNLYTKTKIFHFKDKLNSLPKENGQILPPVHIRIKPTNVCNHNCSYCSYRVKGIQLGQDMSERDFIPEKKMNEIIDDLIDMGVRAVTFTGGGDPFCYKFFLPIIKKLAASSIQFASLTNGSLLKGEIAEVFAKNATWLRVSMDGWDDKSYSEYRGVKYGEFTKVVNNIKEFKSYKGSCYLGASIIVDRKNFDHIFDLVRMLKENDVDSVKISPCIISNDGQENNAYHEPILAKVKEQAERARKEFGKEGLEVYDAYHTQLESFKKKYTWCPYLQILPVIGADQNIYSCHDKAYNLKVGFIGSIKNQSFKDFWFSDKNKFFKIDPFKDCNHHCEANSKNEIILDYLDADLEHLVFV